MRRRQFISQLSCAAACAAAPTPGLALTTTGKNGGKVSTCFEEYPAICLDKICAAIERSDVVAELNKAAEAQGFGSDCAGQVLRSLVAHSAIYDSGSSIATDEAFKARIDRLLGSVEHGHFAMTTLLEEQSLSQRKRFQRYIRRHPDELRSLGDRIADAACRAGVPRNSVNRLTSHWSQMTKYFRSSRRWSFLNQCIRGMDCMLEKGGISRMERRWLARNRSDDDIIVRQNNDREYWGPDPVRGAAGIQTGGDAGDSAGGARRHSRRERRFGAAIIILSSAVAAAVLIPVGVASDLGYPPGLLGAIAGTVSAILLIAGLIVLAIAALTPAQYEGKPDAYMIRLNSAAEWVLAKKGTIPLEEAIIKAAARFRVSRRHLMKELGM